MTLRLLQVQVPVSQKEMLEDLLSSSTFLGTSESLITDQKFLVSHILISSEDADSVMDTLEERFKNVDRFHIVLLPVEASLPRKKIEDDDSPSKEKKSGPSLISGILSAKIGREELYVNIAEEAQLSVAYLLMVALAAIITVIGLSRDDVAVVIGAMVIAPLLGPNVAQCFATTLGDIQLGKKALITNIAGLSLALLLSVVITASFPLNTDSALLHAKTQTGPLDVVLAFATGAAGTMAHLLGASGAIVGVMVAIALMPPLVALGVYLGVGNLPLAFGALLLVATNVIGINLAGIFMFTLHGIRPRSWWEAEKASKAARRASLWWISLLCILVGLMYYSHI